MTGWPPAERTMNLQVTSTHTVTGSGYCEADMVIGNDSSPTSLRAELTLEGTFEPADDENRGVLTVTDTSATGEVEGYLSFLVDLSGEEMDCSVEGDEMTCDNGNELALFLDRE